ncbi:MAG: extracellular solute-binding protein, family 1 [Solirubrobacterales bacterium]|nr:extracellular solute-binding protein, family 1 [Solirubrobacterales bacterium]
MPTVRLGMTTLLALASLVVAACSATSEDSGGGPPEPETEGITLYSGRIAAAIGGAVDIYEAAADRDVQVRFAETGDLAATLVEEGSNSPADVFFAQEPGAIGAVAERALLAELPADILDRVPARFRDPEGRWIGITGRARTLAYGEATERSELPDSPLKLTDPEWEGRVGWAPVTDSLQQYVTALRLEYGDEVAREWVEGMVANEAVDYPNNVAIRDAIANEEVDVGLLNHYYVAQAIAAEGPEYPVGVYFPPEGLGSLLLLTSAGVLESSDRKDEAFDFIRSLLAPESQRYFSASSKEYPLARGVEPDPSLSVALAAIPVPRGDLNDIAEVQATVELMQEAGAL